MNAVVKAEALPIQGHKESTSLIEAIVRMASDPTVNVDNLERLMAMREKMEARQAEVDYNAAMNRAQAGMGRIAADANNPQTRSRYATYGALDKVLRPIYTNEGFALSYDTGDGAPEGCIRVLCYVSHAAGHTRTYHADMPADGKGAKGGDVMTKTHAAGAAMSYGMRYLLKLVFNVAVGEDDNDGNDPLPPYDITTWADAIKDATLEELAKIKTDLVAAKGIPDGPRKNIIAIWNARHRELKGDAK